MCIRAVLFDLDGTLLDSARDFIAILQQMRAGRGLPAMDEQLIRQRVSAGAAAMVALALETAPEQAGFDALKDDFLQRYHANPCAHSRLFAGLAELLQLLEQRQIPWGVATNKPERFARPILHALQLEQRAAVLVCPEQVSQPKPAPDMLLLACRQLDVLPQHALYVGDDLRDIQAAEAAGMPSMSVGYGYHGPQDNPPGWGATHHVTHSTQLAGAILALLQADYPNPSRD
ncbi:HAD-IA family hydrolase [Thiopseudomonas denitrificans]|uniref:Phosphoglycolate phosphatase n=1 Tax=Thiopseudomonas denitrificans TaxID=1501432 RepID=A0A4R6U569_9GAMM|nr:phosphoglycolate phosphatase [Thiopseudomonas denitrificans]